MDFVAMEEIAEKITPRYFSLAAVKGYPLSHRLQVPLIRLNFPRFTTVWGLLVLRLPGLRGHTGII